jgi:methylthioribose-1-phosphate isomerase
MQVRGAPAIAVVGVLSLVVELKSKKFQTVSELCEYVKDRLTYLVSARPTAVNMADARQKLVALLDGWMAGDNKSVEELQDCLVKAMERMQKDDIKGNLAMSQFGANHIASKCGSVALSLLTHCNTGSLATAGYGTALGVVRALHERKLLSHCYCTETRPYNQGARLTAYELVYEQIPATLICDSMVATLMSRRRVSAVVTGADRIAANGDTANKVGTYQIAIIARHHNVPFYVVAPSTSVDLNTASGDEIVIEERSALEMTSIAGVPVAAKGIACWNPAFDVTPAELITGGIVTEFGVFAPEHLKESLLKAFAK